MAYPFDSPRTPKKVVGRGLNLKASRLSRFFSPFAGEGNGRVTAQGRPAAGDVSGRTCSSISEDTRRIADELFASSTLLGWGEGYTPSSVRLGTEMLERSNKPSRRVGSSSRGTEGSNPSTSSGESTANLASSFRVSHRPRASRPRRRPPTVERVEHAPEEPRRGMDRTIDRRKSPRTLLIIIFDIAAAYRASERSWPSGARPRRS